MEALKVEEKSCKGLISLGQNSLLYEDESGCQHAQPYHFQYFPEIEMTTPVCVYVPMECLLARFISLPLQQASLVDADMMFQELANSCDVQEAEWWLSWDLKPCDTGVAGMLFGLPESWRISMHEHTQAAQTPYVWVDGYERLQSVLIELTPSLVLDQDIEGVFVGVHDGQVWRGMRRINGSIDTVRYQEIRYACTAMGFDKQSFCVQGCVQQSLLDMLLAEELNWQGRLLETLPDRHKANVMLADRKGQGLNLRHGVWGLRQGWQFLKPWKRSGVLAVLLLLVWLGSTVVDLYRLDHAMLATQQRVETAFHKGLPNEPVMLDALAQLNQAAGGVSVQKPTFLMGLQAISQVYKKYAWHISSLELRDGEMYMAGEVKDIKALNQIQVELKQALQQDVRIADTNMNGKQVAFRMSW